VLHPWRIGSNGVTNRTGPRDLWGRKCRNFEISLRKRMKPQNSSQPLFESLIDPPTSDDLYFLDPKRCKEQTLVFGTETKFLSDLKSRPICLARAN